MGTRKGISLREMVRRHWLVLAVGYVFIFYDPFSISAKTGQAVSDAFDRLFSPFYSDALAMAPHSESRDLVDVILIDDLSILTLSNEENAYLRANDWPLAYSDHGVVIDALRRRGYGTVILDITFYRARRQDKTFQSLVTRLNYFRNHLDMKVILSAGENPDELEDSIKPLISAVSGLGLAGWSGYGDDYPINLLVGCEQPVRSLAVEGYCSKAGWQECDKLFKAEDSWPVVPKASGMHLSWGMPAQRMASSINCDSHPPGAGFLEMMKVGMRNAFKAETVSSEGRQACPPLPTATLSDVFCTGSDCGDFFSAVESDGERIAVVGVSLPSARDLFNPPIPGQLPGVYLHAEALRNLLHYGPEYLKPIGLTMTLQFTGMPALTVPFDLILAWPLLLWVGLVLARRLVYWRWARGIRSERSELAMELGEVMAALLLLSLIYVGARSMNRTPGFLTELVALMPWFWIAIRNERKEMENERTTLALAACTSEQRTTGGNSAD